MVDRTETIKRIEPASVGRYMVGEATVDTNDTITLSDFTTVNGACARKIKDGAVVAVTVATNVITVTEVALDEEQIVFLAHGKP